MELGYNIVLCGFMGCGKSTVGRKLARLTGLCFVDMDDYIEQQAGMRVSQIFDQFGEAHFRDLEYEAAKELAGQSGLVIATGGGVLTFRRNEEALRRTGKIVLLDPPFSIIRRRLQGDTTRPLLQKPNREAVMRQLYDQRMPIYRAAADLTVDTVGTPAAVCREVLRLLKISPQDSQNEG